MHRITRFFIWLTMFSGFFVVFEPAPFDALMMGLIVLLPVVGLTRINSYHLGLTIVWCVIVVTGLFAVAAAIETTIAMVHIFVTFYLALASIVIAAYVSRDPEDHSRLILHGLVAAAFVAAIAGTAGYFDIPPGAKKLFTVFDRAKGMFKDPNVFAPFLVMPIVYLLHVALTRGAVRAGLAIAGIGVLGLAVLLSFSRGAWANLAVATIVYGAFSFVTARTDRQRAKMIGFAVVLGVAVFSLVAFASGNDAVERLFSQRATLDQSYDVGPEGRFGGQEKAWQLILQHPFGIGALQFGGFRHSEQPHNVYLSQFLNGGWIGGFAYLFLVVASLVLGFKALLKRKWEASTLLVVFSAFTGMVVEGFVVETDHWRTFFIQLGLLWGIIGAGSAQEARAVSTDRLATALRSGLATPALPVALAAIPLGIPRRAPRIVPQQRRASTVTMSAVPPRRKKRRYEPKRKARLVLH